MVNVGDKPIQQRTAIAEGIINMDSDTIRLIKENSLTKGDVIGVAKIAGIQAAKKTSGLIPLCHPLLLNQIDVEFELNNTSVKAISTVKCDGKTGVEMEALTAVSVALLTVYDMCKAVDKGMVISEVKLISKHKI